MKIKILSSRAEWIFSEIVYEVDGETRKALFYGSTEDFIEALKFQERNRQLIGKEIII